MTLDEVRALVREQAEQNLLIVNHHGIRLADAVVPPETLTIVSRTVKDGHVIDETLDVWLVGLEISPDGYKIILRDDGQQFGLASRGLPFDQQPILVGWFGSLLSAFIAM
jgi:hypothetical protein